MFWFIQESPSALWAGAGEGGIDREKPAERG